MTLLRHSNMGATRKSLYLHISQLLLSILKAEYIPGLFQCLPDYRGSNSKGCWQRRLNVHNENT